MACLIKTKKSKIDSRNFDAEDGVQIFLMGNSVCTVDQPTILNCIIEIHEKKMAIRYGRGHGKGLTTRRLSVMSYVMTVIRKSIDQSLNMVLDQCIEGVLAGAISVVLSMLKIKE